MTQLASKEMTVHVECRTCRGTTSLTVDKDKYEEWRRGALVQNCFPDMSVEDRELLVSQTCDKCWQEMFPAEEGDE